MNRDITFCVTKICPYKYTCKRHVDNNAELINEQYISMADFEHTNTDCKYFIK